MTTTDLIVLLPLIIPALAGTGVMLAGAFGARGNTLHALTLGGVGAAIAAVIFIRPLAPRDVTLLLRVDAYSILFLGLLLGATGVVAIISRTYMKARARDSEAYGSLLLFGAVGMGVLACSTHFASFFLGLEILTVVLYVLLGYLRDERASLEAAAKYLILAAMASAFLLFGIALLYAATGSLVLDEVAARVSTLATFSEQPEGVWAIVGVLMLLVGFAFKLALVPFHMWSPDVYQGAPAPVAALIASGSKGAVVAVLLRMTVIDSGGAHLLGPLFGAVAILTMFAGNLLALLQTDIKRLLAYSSIAHIGYIFVGIAAGGRLGTEAVVFYMIPYIATTLGAFAVVSLLSAGNESDADDLAAYRGLGRRRPGLAMVLGLMLLSLAGIPPTGGFLGKFTLLAAAISAGRTGLAVAMVLASGIAIFYYLRVLVVMYMEPVDTGDTGGATTPVAATGGSLGGTLALALLSAVVLAVGLFPDPWFRAVGAAVTSIFGS